jgi:hypothetical protein
LLYLSLYYVVLLTQSTHFENSLKQPIKKWVVLPQPDGGVVCWWLARRRRLASCKLVGVAAFNFQEEYRGAEEY